MPLSSLKVIAVVVNPKLYISIFTVALILNAIVYKQFILEQWMRYKLRNQTIVVSLSTTPYRIGKMQATIASILRQNVKLDGIYVSVPYVFKRDNIAYAIPEWLQHTQGVTILRTQDYGPGTKLLGLLEQTNLPANAIIVTVDDDVIYPKNMVLHLAYKASLNPNSAVGLMGADPEYDANGVIGTTTEVGLIKTTATDAIVSVLQGYGGVAYRRSFFQPNIFDIIHAPTECINSDDLYLSFHLAQQNITRQVLRNQYVNACDVRWETEIGTNEFALHQLSPKPRDKHRICIAYLKQLSPNTKF